VLLSPNEAPKNTARGAIIKRYMKLFSVNIGKNTPTAARKAAR
jgi:hypothetical protein